MEKPQVTFALTASGLLGKVGSPILVVSAVLERNHHELVLMRGIHNQVYETARIANLEVPLNNDHLEHLAAWVEGEFRSAVIPAFGVQMQVDLVDPLR